ncbi:MAG: hypothetical protein M1828_002024 [Chrysothrix sp. TS-e1954]|nr:MAG: hypothetical protein M1828_002024 [Chrysothrix sp. TS-e1954]
MSEDEDMSDADASSSEASSTLEKARNGPLHVDIATLKAHDEAFAEVLERKKGVTDFKDVETSLQMTKSTLKVYFDLVIDLPEDRLCPPVPVRHEYIRWLHGLVDSTASDFRDECDVDRDSRVVGVDIGTGASCIYPLLGCASRRSWRFLGTEVDSKSFEYAVRNVKSNDLESRVKLVKVPQQDDLLPLEKWNLKNVDFAMCNPPFYKSEEYKHRSNEKKEMPPSAVCIGTDTEMVTPGGDLGFATRILQESQTHTHPFRAKWYTCMLGKLASVDTLVARIKEVGITNWAIGCLAPGNKTRRWVVGWSYDDLRPRNSIARSQVTVRATLPFPTEFDIEDLPQDEGLLPSLVNATLEPLHGVWRWDHDTLQSGVFTSSQDVWSRSYRRKLEHTGKTQARQETHENDDDSTVTFATRIRLDASKGCVTIRWLKGDNHVLYESFSSMMKRELTKGFGPPSTSSETKQSTKDWYKRHLHIHYSSRSATFSADPKTGKQRRLTGLGGPSASATLSFPQPEGLSQDDDNIDDDDASEEQEADAAASTAIGGLDVPRASPPNDDIETGQGSKVKAPDDNQQPKEDVQEQTATFDSSGKARSEADPAESPEQTSADVQTNQDNQGADLQTLSPTATAEASDEACKTKTLQQESSGSYATANESAGSRGSRKGPSQMGVIGEDSSSNASLKTAPDTPRHSQSSARATNDSPRDHDSRSSLLGHNQTDGTVKSKVMGKRNAGGHTSSLSKTSTTLRRKSNSVHDNVTVESRSPDRAAPGLVRFNLPENEPVKQQQMNLRLAQMRKRDTLKRIRGANMTDGQIVKMENMLVRVESTMHEMPEDFDENDGQRIDSTVLAKWKEYMVVCRESEKEDAPFVLQMYTTRVITAVDESSRRCAHRIVLQKSDCHINIFSSLDKTIVIWAPGKKKGSKMIYILQARSSASSMEWYTFIRHVLGWARPSSLQVRVPDLEINVELENAFAAVESSRDVAQAAQGDEEALIRTMKEEQAIASNVVTRCTDMLGRNHDWKAVLDLWSGSQRVGLAWKRYDRLEWVHGANEQKMYGTIGMERSHELELRPKEHYPTIASIKQQEHMIEPPPVEGFLIRLTSQKGTDKKFGKLFFKRLYFSTHNQYLVFNRPARADPPPPPKLPMQDRTEIPSAQEIADQIPLIYSISPFPVKDGQVAWLSEGSAATKQELLHHDHDAFDENQRKINNVLSCDGVINLCNIADVRDVDRGATAADEDVGQNIAVDFNQDVANTDRDDGTTKAFDDTRTFELLLQNELVVRLQAYDATTKKEWMERLKPLITYWKARTAADIALLKFVRKQNLLQMNVDEESEAHIGQYARKWEVRNSFASPELYNMCGISCCRSIHMSGLLWRRPRMHGTFRRNLVVLSHGHLVYFQDALRRRDGKLLAHIHHERVGGLDLRQCYVYSGLITEKDLLYTSRTFDTLHPGHHALPRVYLEDGWNSTDEDTMTTFVVWHGRRRGWFRSSQAETDGKSAKKHLRHVHRLGAEGRSVIFKTRSRAERDRWVLAIGMEIERLSQGDEVRIVEDGGKS